MKIVANVMAMRERADMLEALMPRLDGLDPEARWGDRSEGIWANASRCWLDDRGATHVLVIQEDVTVCDDFAETLYEIVRAVPDQPISLFCRGEGVENAVNNGIRWATVTGRAWGQANLMPVALAAEFVREADFGFAHNLVQPDNDDGRLQRWLERSRRPLWCPVPCPVQHLGVRSTVEHQSHQIVAREGFFIPEGTSGLDFDWRDVRTVELDSTNTGSYYKANGKVKYG